MKKLLSLLLVASMLFVMTACGNDDSKKDSDAKDKETQTEQNSSTNNNVSNLYENKINFTIELENGGIMKGVLFPDLAPKTVENFVKLADDKFYDGLIFHRVIKDFMIQGGGYDDNVNHKDAESIKGEFTRNGFTNNLKHTRGVLSMARTSFPNSASSQFFIMHKDYPSLDGQYAAFGKITEGLEYVDEIAEAKTTVYEPMGMENVPVEPIIIKTITIDK